MTAPAVRPPARPHPVPATAPGSGQLTVARATTLAEASAFAGFHRAHHRHPESHHDLWSAVLQARTDGSHPYVLQVRRDGHACALLVGQVVPTRLPWRIGYKTVLVSNVRVLEVLHGGLLGEHSPEVCDRLFDAVHAELQQGRIHAAHLRRAPSGSPLHLAFQNRPSVICRDRMAPTALHWQLSLPDSFAAFRARQSKKTREDMARFDNRLRKQFGPGIAVERLRHAHQVPDCMRTIDGIAARTYQRGLGAGFQDDADTRARWCTAAAQGMLWAHVLRLDGEPAAFVSGYALGDTLHLEHLGFDPRFRRFQPGTWLLFRVIEEACADPALRRIDFGSGDADYKRRYCTDSDQEVSVFVFAPTAHGAWLSAVRSTTSWLTVGLSRVLARAGLLTWLKGRWRRRLAAADATPADVGTD